MGCAPCVNRPPAWSVRPGSPDTAFGSGSQVKWLWSALWVTSTWASRFHSIPSGDASSHWVSAHQPALNRWEGLGMTGTFIEHAGPVLDGGGELEETVGTIPVDAVVRFQVAEVSSSRRHRRCTRCESDRRRGRIVPKTRVASFGPPLQSRLASVSELADGSSVCRFSWLWMRWPSRNRCGPSLSTMGSAAWARGPQRKWR